MTRIPHHATLSIAAYGFLVSETETILPRDFVPGGYSRKPDLLDSYRTPKASLAA